MSRDIPTFKCIFETKIRLIAHAITLRYNIDPTLDLTLLDAD